MVGWLGREWVKPDVQPSPRGGLWVTRKYAILTHFPLHEDWHGVTLATRYGPLSTLS